MADRWYNAGYSSGASGKTLKLHVYTVETNINDNWTKERADLWLSVTNASGGYWNGYGSPATIGVNNNNTTQNVAWDARSVGDKLLIGTWDTIVYHDADGSKTISVRGIHQSGTALGDADTGTQNYQCDTIPRASVPTLSKTDIKSGDKVDLITNRKSDSFSHSIYLNYGNSRTLVATNIYTAWEFNTNNYEEILKGQIKSSNVGYGGLELETYQNGTKIGNSQSVSFSYTIVNSKPIFSNFTFADVDNKTTALTTSNQNIIKKYSDLEVTISNANKAQATDYANMSKYKLQNSNKQIEANYSNTSDVKLKLENVESDTINVYAIDSRGNSTLITKKATLINYEDIIIKNIEISRNEGNVGTGAILKFNGTFWNGNFGKKTNTIKSVTYKYKNTSSSAWNNGITAITLTIKENKFEFEGQIAGDLGAEGFSLSNNFDIQITLADELSNITDNVTLQAATPALAFGKDGVALGQKYDENLGGVLQIASNTAFNGDLNDLQTTGFYYTESAINRPNAIEKSSKGFLIVQKVSNMLMQIFLSTNCHRAFFRNKQNDAEWSGWWNILVGYNDTGRAEIRDGDSDTPWLFIETEEEVKAYGVNMWRSDKRFKKNIKDSKYKALDKLMQIKHREFIWKNNNKKIELGVVADELEGIDKNLIFEVGDKKIKQINENKYIVLLSKAVQEQQEIINNLNKRIEKLEEIICKKKKN